MVTASSPTPRLSQRRFNGAQFIAVRCAHRILASSAAAAGFRFG
jgi:hypothetical protein